MDKDNFQIRLNPIGKVITSLQGDSLKTGLETAYVQLRTAQRSLALAAQWTVQVAAWLFTGNFFF